MAAASADPQEAFRVGLHGRAFAEARYGSAPPNGGPDTAPGPNEQAMLETRRMPGLTEARDFYYAQEKRFPLRVVECFANEKHRPALVVALRHLRYPGNRYLNRYAHTLWAVFERTD